MADSPKARAPARARSGARRLALQALYQWQLNAQPWQDLHQQYLASEEMERADREYFRELIEHVSNARAELDAELQAFVDPPLAGLDPIAPAILLIGLYVLKSGMD